MKVRVLSAIIMIAVAIPLLIIGGLPFAVFLTLLAAIGMYELIHIREEKKKFPLFVKIVAYLLVILFSMNNFDSIEFVYNISYKAVAVVFLAFLAPVVFVNDNKKYNLNDAFFLASSVLFLGLSFNLMMVTRNFDWRYIIYLLLITTMTDTFALFTGMFIGKNKLAPKISPNKTIEGAIGGSLMGTFVASAFFMNVINSSAPLVFVILVTFGLTCVGQIGDLLFSAIKRYYGKKDFSNIIPGHGGILDRFDSLIFVLLTFILVLGIII